MSPDRIFYLHCSGRGIAGHFPLLFLTSGVLDILYNLGLLTDSVQGLLVVLQAYSLISPPLRVKCRFLLRAFRSPSDTCLGMYLLALFSPLLLVMELCTWENLL